MLATIWQQKTFIKCKENNVTNKMPAKRPLEIINFKLPSTLCAASKNTYLYSDSNATGSSCELRYCLCVDWCRRINVCCLFDFIQAFVNADLIRVFASILIIHLNAYHMQMTSAQSAVSVECDRKNEMHFIANNSIRILIYLFLSAENFQDICAAHRTH